MPKPYNPNDAWSRRAAKEGYRARSVYKLEELNERYRLLRPGMTVLDCGAAPGSWLQYTAKIIGPRGRAIGLDLTPIKTIAANVVTLEQDITDLQRVERVLKETGVTTVDLVLSDAAPSTTGIRDIDQWQSLELARAVIAIAEHVLKPSGRCVIKVFRGADFDEFLADVKRRWVKVTMARTKASRDRSHEVYLVLHSHA